jgi:hypothetical protein
LVTGVLSGGDKIWTWSGSSFWCTKKIKNMSERCARSREEFHTKEKRKRWPKFTVTFAGVHRYLRIGEVECGQPGGDLVRVFGRERCAGGRVFIGARRRRNRNRIRRIYSG